MCLAVQKEHVGVSFLVETTIVIINILPFDSQSKTQMDYIVFINFSVNVHISLTCTLDPEQRGQSINRKPQKLFNYINPGTTLCKSVLLFLQPPSPHQL